MEKSTYERNGNEREHQLEHHQRGRVDLRGMRRGGIHDRSGDRSTRCTSLHPEKSLRLIQKGNSEQGFSFFDPFSRRIYMLYNGEILSTERGQNEGNVEQAR